MRRPRQNHSAAFKTKVALEAVRGELPLTELTDKYDVHAGCKALQHQDTDYRSRLINDRELPFFEEQQMSVLRMLTNRGTNFCGKAKAHDYQLYLALNDVEHTKTKVMPPQTNGICERFHKTILQEFYQLAFRRKIYRSLEALQIDLDQWLLYNNHDRTH